MVFLQINCRELTFPSFISKFWAAVSLYFQLHPLFSATFWNASNTEKENIHATARFYQNGKTMDVPVNVLAGYKCLQNLE